MKREEKDVIIGEIAELLTKYPNVYITDTSALTVGKTNQLRRLCFAKGVKMLVAKNSLIQKAMEKKMQLPMKAYFLHFLEPALCCSVKSEMNRLNSSKHSARLEMKNHF